MVMQRGVSLNELEQGARTGGFDTKSTGFSKKNNKGNKILHWHRGRPWSSAWSIIVRGLPLRLNDELHG